MKIIEKLEEILMCGEYFIKEKEEELKILVAMNYTKITNLKTGDVYRAEKFFSGSCLIHEFLEENITLRKFIVKMQKEVVYIDDEEVYFEDMDSEELKNIYNPFYRTLIKPLEIKNLSISNIKKLLKHKDTQIIRELSCINRFSTVDFKNFFKEDRKVTRDTVLQILIEYGNVENMITLKDMNTIYLSIYSFVTYEIYNRNVTFNIEK